jgi:hypothetical protein
LVGISTFETPHSGQATVASVMVAGMLESKAVGVAPTHHGDSVAEAIRRLDTSVLEASSKLCDD